MRRIVGAWLGVVLSATGCAHSGASPGARTPPDARNATPPAAPASLLDPTATEPASPRRSVETSTPPGPAAVFPSAHRGPLATIELAASGGVVAAIGSDGVVSIVDVATGRLRAYERPWQRSLEGVHLSVDGTGTRVLVGAIPGAGVARTFVWDLVEDRWIELARGSVEEAGALALAIAPDGREVALAVADGPGEEASYVLAFVDAASGEGLAQLPIEGWVGGLAYSPDGARLHAHLEDPPRLLVVDRRSHAVHATLGDVATGPLAFRPGGGQMITVGADRALEARSPSTGALLGRFEGRLDDGPEPLVRYDAEGRCLVTYGSGSRPKVFDARTGALLGEAAEETSAALPTRGCERLVVATERGGLRSVPVRPGTGEPVELVAGREDASPESDLVTALRASPDGRELVVARGADLLFVDASTGAIRAEVRGGRGEQSVWDAAIAPDGSAVASTGRGYVDLFGRSFFGATGCGGPSVLRFDASGRLVASGPGGACVDGRALEPRNVVAVAEDGRALVVPDAEASPDDGLALVVVETSSGNRRKLRIPGLPACDPEGFCRASVRIAPDGRTIAASSLDEGKLVLVDVRSGRELASRPVVEGTIGAFSSDARTFFARTPDALVALPLPRGRARTITPLGDEEAVAFSTSTLDGFVVIHGDESRIVSLATGRTVLSVPDEGDVPTRIDATDSPRVFVTSPPSGAPFALVLADQGTSVPMPGRLLAVSPDGRLAATLEHGRLHVHGDGEPLDGPGRDLGPVRFAERALFARDGRSLLLIESTYLTWVSLSDGARTTFRTMRSVEGAESLAYDTSGRVRVTDPSLPGLVFRGRGPVATTPLEPLEPGSARLDPSLLSPSPGSP